MITTVQTANQHLPKYVETQSYVIAADKTKSSTKKLFSAIANQDTFLSTVSVTNVLRDILTMLTG